MERIGFIGVGIMGSPMAHRLLQAGYHLTVRDLHPEREQPLAGEGAALAPSACAVAELSDVIILMLPDSPDTLDVVFGKAGVLEGLRAGSLIIDMSTISPAAARQVAAAAREKGADALDAPVSGGQVGAQDGTLSIMVGGSDASFARALPILEHMGKRILHMGEAGAGQVTKAANQILVGVTVTAVAEALVMAAKAGVDPAKVREALLGGFAQSRVLEAHGLRMLQRNFKPGFKAVLQRKDLAIALDTGRQIGVSLPTTAAAAEMFNALLARSGPDIDHAALVTVLEALAQHEIGAG